MRAVTFVTMFVIALVGRFGVARACATAPPDGFEVDIDAEDALIVFDSASKKEHFIRRANFRSEAPNFGFLVPTPSKPELGEVPDEVFDRLTRASRPRVEKRERWKVEVTSVLSFFFLSAGDKSISASADRGVEVLGTARVAGFDAAILRADDSDALASWLTEHGYPFRDDLDAWVRAYIDKKWIITAFKIAPPPEETQRASHRPISTAAVRMTFDVDRPYPYREPKRAGPARGNRSLRVFVVSDARVEGHIGDATAWPPKGEVLYAKQRDDLHTLLPELTLSANDLWLTAMIDTSSPRPGTDELWFSKSNDQSTFERVEVRDDVRTIPIPIDLIVLFIGGGLVTFFVVRRQRRATRGAT